eukprot:15462312-Alexandrium_andersonii.AAC.1
MASSGDEGAARGRAPPEAAHSASRSGDEGTARGRTHSEGGSGCLCDVPGSRLGERRIELGDPAPRPSARAPRPGAQECPPEGAAP